MWPEEGSGVEITLPHCCANNTDYLMDDVGPSFFDRSVPLRTIGTLNRFRLAENIIYYRTEVIYTGTCEHVANM